MPLVKVALLFTFGIVASDLIDVGESFALILLLILALFQIVAIRYKIIFLSHLILPIIILVCSGYLFGLQSGNSLKNKNEFYLEDAIVSGVVNDVSLAEQFSRIILSDLTINCSDYNFHPAGKMLINNYTGLKFSGIMPDDTIRFRGNVQSIKAPSNPGENDRREYYHSREIFAKVNISDTSQILDFCKRTGFATTKIVYNIRKAVSERINNLYPVNGKTNGIVKAMLLGERGDLDNPVYEEFVTGGIVHILAVSGLHTGYVILIFLFLFGRAGLKGKLLFTIAGVILFVFISGASQPVIRAAVMCIIYMLAIIFSRDSNPFNSLALAYLVLVVLNPHSIYEVGFQLSFAAVLGILIVMRLLAPIYKKYLITGVRRKVITFFAVLFVAQIATAPVLLYHFGYFAITGILNNLLVLPLIGFVLFSSILSIIFSLISGYIATSFAGAVNMLFSGIMNIVEFTNDVAGTFVSVEVTIWWILLYLFCVFTLLWAIFAKKPVLHRVVFSIITIFLFLYLSPIVAEKRFENGNLHIITFDVGQGDSFLIITPNRKTILIDVGNYLYPDRGKHVILPFLRRYGLDFPEIIYISHLDADHAGGLISLIEKHKPQQIYLPPEDNSVKYIFMKRHLRENNIQTVDYSPKKIRIDNVGIYILRDYLQNGSLFVTENDRSGVLKLVFGETSILFTGDAGFLVEERYIKKYGDFLKSDILKVSHHGSRFGSSQQFLNAVQPRYAIISAGKRNRYGHPADEVIQRIKNTGSIILRTDLSGAIILESNGKNISQLNWKNW